MVYLNLRENDIPHIEWVQWNSTVGSESYPLPSFLKDYFKANCPGKVFMFLLQLKVKDSHIE